MHSGSGLVAFVLSSNFATMPAAEIDDAKIRRGRIRIVFQLHIFVPRCFSFRKTFFRQFILFENRIRGKRKSII